jgi:hypothetical protein
MLSRISFLSSWSETLSVACLSMVFSLAGSFSFAHEWADATGKYRITAEYVRVENKNVILRKPDGRELSVAIASLDEASRALAKQHYSKEKEKAAPLPAQNSKFKAEPDEIDLPTSNIATARPRSRYKSRRFKILNSSSTKTKISLRFLSALSSFANERSPSGLSREVCVKRAGRFCGLCRRF